MAPADNTPEHRPDEPVTIDEALITPEGSMEVLSQLEVARLRLAGAGTIHDLFRRCALAVLTTGSEVDDAKLIFERYQDFDVELIQQDRGIKLKVCNAPAQAFVDGKMIRGLRAHLFSVLRDILYIRTEIQDGGHFDLGDTVGITNAVFHILRHAGVLLTVPPKIVVCWGGHSIGREEYDYTKEVGYQLGLRGLDICTGCGPGAMKGPMKGAAIGHGKQRIRNARYIGISEPGIIAAEAPNALVNELVIMPDIEKRLEAFARIGHGFAVFPGGVGTAEEILYLLGILMNPANEEMSFPLVLTGPESSADYFTRIDAFIRTTLGDQATRHYEIIIGDPPEVARRIAAGLETVQDYRVARSDAFFFNWLLSIDHDFQQPFEATHENMGDLVLSDEIPRHQLASNLRRAFSGIVAGNVKDQGIRAVEAHGPFELRGQARIIEPLGALLEAFVEQKRMKLPLTEYVPCFKVVAAD